MASQNPPLILASGSAIRAQMLRQALLDFTIDPADIDEAALKETIYTAGGSPRVAALALAKEKALAAAARNPGAWVIGADQTLECDDISLDKPTSMGKLGNHLRLLSGKSHFLHSAVTIAQQDAEGGHVIWQTVETAIMTMRQLSAEDIRDYAMKAGDSACQSVGGYQLEGYGVTLFDHIDGDYFTILGLPLLPLLGFLRASQQEMAEKPEAAQ